MRRRPSIGRQFGSPLGAGALAMGWCRPELRRVGELPLWLGRRDLHLSHRSSLLRKDSRSFSRRLTGGPPVVGAYYGAAALVSLWVHAPAAVVRRVFQMTDSVSEDILVDADHPGRIGRTMMRLEWQRHAPIAVRMHLTTLPDHPALPRGDWSVLRDFLRYGLDEPTGDGDVRIVPDPNGRHVTLQLIFDGRRSCIELPRSTVLAFLDRTEVIEPSGEAGEAATLDILVARLLEGEPGS
ncbi:MAG: SsgA family sporulation/cell division regulator [Actinomycetota bacterium]